MSDVRSGPADRLDTPLQEPSTPGLARNSTMVALGTGLSRVTGMLHVVALAVVLGGGRLADAYNLANVSPNIIYELLLGGVLSATLVPLFVQAVRRNDVDGPSAVFSVSTLALITLTVGAVLAAPWIASLYGSRSSGPGAAAERGLVITFLHLILPEILFYGIAALSTAALHARRRFVAAAFAPVLNNVIVIGVLIALGVTTLERVPVIRHGSVVLGADGHAVTTLQSGIADSTAAQIVLGLGTTAGILVMALVLIPAMRRAGVRLVWRPRLSDPMVRRVARLSGWTLGYVIANQVALVAILALANKHGAGTVTAYQNAFIYFQLPHGLIAVSVMTTFLPELSDAFARSLPDRFSSTFVQGVRMMAVLVVPAAVALVVLAVPVARVFLGHGAYSAAAAGTAGRTLQAFAFGLPGFSIYLFALRGFYARQDTRTPFFINLAENGLNIVLALTFASRGAPGLAAAYAIAYSVAGVLALAMLARRVDGLIETGRSAVRPLGRVLASSAAMLAVLLLVNAVLPSGSGSDAVVLLCIAVPLGLATYGAVAVASGVDGARSALRWIALRFRHDADDAEDADAGSHG